jgi:hypothetical protein
MTTAPIKEPKVPELISVTDAPWDDTVVHIPDELPTLPPHHQQPLHNPPSVSTRAQMLPDYLNDLNAMNEAEHQQPLHNTLPPHHQQPLHHPQPASTRAQAIHQSLLGQNPEAYLMNGLEEALIGIGQRHGMLPVAVYSEDKIHQIHMERDGMSEDDAIEFFEYNIAGAWLGEGTPIIVDVYFGCS